jgi:hypothetical protein
MNGQLGESLRFKRGVRSPYLFDSIADVLQRLCCLAFEQGSLLHPLDVDSFFPILQYPDDTLILLKGELSQAAVIKQNLQAFLVCNQLP